MNGLKVSKKILEEVFSSSLYFFVLEYFTKQMSLTRDNMLTKRLLMFMDLDMQLYCKTGEGSNKIIPFKHEHLQISL